MYPTKDIKCKENGEGKEPPSKEKQQQQAKLVCYIFIICAVGIGLLLSVSGSDNSSSSSSNRNTTSYAAPNTQQTKLQQIIRKQPSEFLTWTEIKETMTDSQLTDFQKQTANDGFVGRPVLWRGVVDEVKERGLFETSYNIQIHMEDRLWPLNLVEEVIANFPESQGEEILKLNVGSEILFYGEYSRWQSWGNKVRLRNCIIITEDVGVNFFHDVIVPYHGLQNVAYVR